MSVVDTEVSASYLRRDPAPKSTAPAVSVIIPTFNRARLLSAALDSVYRQTFRDFEVLVVDDGSNDGTAELVSSRNQGIRYFWQHNQGAAAARNHALRKARGEFVAFLDSDDLWMPTFLEKAVGRLREHPEEVLVFTDFLSMDATGRILRGHRKRPYGGDVTARLFASTFICTPAVVVRRAIIRDAGGFNEQLSHNEDYDLWLRLSLRHRFGLIPEPLFLRRCHRESLSRNGCTPEILLRKADLLQNFYQNGGNDKIPADLARRRLAKLYYTAGKAFLKAGRPGEAQQILQRSMRFDRGRMKTWLWYFGAQASRLIRPGQGKPPTPTA